MDDIEIERQAWKLLLMYAESGMDDDIDEDGEFDEDDYRKIQGCARQIIRELRVAHVAA